MVATSLSLLLGLPLSALCQLIALPTPPLSTNVLVTSFPLTDHTRVDPFAPCCNQPRHLMLSLFQPAKCAQVNEILYMPPATAAVYDEGLAQFGIPNGTFESFRLQTCSQLPKENDLPLLLFSPGLGTSRYLYSVLLQWVASMGFNIVAIDHPYDAGIVEFPDGRIILGPNITIPDDIDKALASRVADVSTVLNAVSNSTIATGLGMPCLPTKRIGMFGHSLGGATTANAMLVEPRIIGGLNMDGGIWGEAVNETNKRPFTIFTSMPHNQTSDPTLAAFWSQLIGSKLLLQVNGAMHNSYPDFPILANNIGINATVVPAIEELIGTIDGIRMLEVLKSYIGGFFQHVLEAKEIQLLQGPSAEFPEVAFVNASAGTAG